VLHAWWGLNQTIKDICTRLADNGYTAFAPDLYHGQVTDQIAEAETLAGAIFENLDQARDEVAQAASFLYEHLGSPEDGLAVMGFSLGAFFALDLSNSAPETIRSVVTFYGTGPDDFSASQSAYLCHFAETDEFEPQESVDALAAALKAAGRPMTFHTYPGAGHWFFEPDRPDAYDPEAANLAWERTLAFLKQSR
jgi:carboxymethylenebutenolidase